MDRNTILILKSTVGTYPPVICEAPTDTYPPESEADLWQTATEEEYQAYLTYWDNYYARHEGENA